MPNVRVATFNCENLFARYKFEKNVDPAKVTKDGFTIDRTKFTILKEDEKALTAKASLAIDADVLALQEVENLEVLRRFRSDRLKKAKYVHGVLIDGPDPRHIDVAVLSRHPIVHVRSYQHVRDGSAAVFSRDCLEVDVDVKGKNLTLFVNHFKSMFDQKDRKNGRKNTRAKRLKQAKAVRDIVRGRFGPSPGGSAWIVLGDLYDYHQADQGTTTGIADLVGWDQLENVLDRLPQADRWTHFYDKTNSYRQLDYLLVSNSLAAGTGQPQLIRKGLTTKATMVTETRFLGVTGKIAASDHCPLAIDVSL
jgi:endonuclease/exonuclease/phosphatase family metal-dependent hydrolase